MMREVGFYGKVRSQLVADCGFVNFRLESGQRWPEVLAGKHGFHESE